MDENDLRWLLEFAESENLAEVEVHEGGVELLVRTRVPEAAAAWCAPAFAEALAAPAGRPLPENHLPVLSPMAGVFYRSSAPGTRPFVEASDHVEHGDTVGTIEAMKLFNEIPAPASGTVVRFLLENGARVEADQAIMIIELQGPR